MIKPGHDQGGYAVRCEWGPAGAAAVPADIAVVVDVLSFTTTVTIAVGRGIAVLPYRWRDESAQAYAASRGALLAVGRLEAREQAGQVSLSPAAMAAVSGVERIVLPSPNGSTITQSLAGTGARVVAGSLRNAAAVADHLAPLVHGGATCVVVPAGERWPDGSLRPCAEDLWGAGAILSALVDRGVGGLSPEARLATHAWAGVRLPADLHDCAGGRELAAAGFTDDVAVAAEADAGDVVPVLDGEAFVDAG
ncbi:2-phosphosulfolactate phosphatase [Nocardioides sp. P5_C9_2]